MPEPRHYDDSNTAYTVRWWAEPHYQNWPLDVDRLRNDPTWHSLDYEGPSQTRVRIEAQGTQQVQVTNPRIKDTYGNAPGAFISAAIDGGIWWIRLGATVTIPNAIVTVLEGAGFTVTAV